MLTVIKKISNEINEGNRPDVIETFKDVLVESFELTAQEKTFYSLPLEIIFDVISKVDFSSFECDASLLKTIVKNTITAHPNEKETLFLLHFLKTNFIPLKLNECVGILSSFNNSELCLKLGELYAEIDAPSLDVALNKFHYKKGFEPYKFNLPNLTKDAMTASGNSYSCTQNATMKVWCTALIQLNGWKIPNDYPFKVK